MTLQPNPYSAALPRSTEMAPQPLRPSPAAAAIPSQAATRCVVGPKIVTTWQNNGSRVGVKVALDTLQQEPFVGLQPFGGFAPAATVPPPALAAPAAVASPAPPFAGLQPLAALLQRPTYGVLLWRLLVDQRHRLPLWRLWTLQTLAPLAPMGSSLGLPPSPGRGQAVSALLAPPDSAPNPFGDGSGYVHAAASSL